MYVGKKSSKTNSSTATVKRGKKTGAKRGRKPKQVIEQSMQPPLEPAKRGRKPKAKRGRKAGTKVVSMPVQKTAPVEESQIKKRHVLCFFNPKTNKLTGTYLDFEHASNVTGIPIADIKSDVSEGTEKTGGVWIKAPVGKNVNHREINKIAREKYKKVKTVKRGRRPIDMTEATKTVKGLNINSLDEAAIKKINRILKSAQKTVKGKKAVMINQ